MSTVSNATLQRDVFPAALSRRVAGAVRRWWAAYMKWRLDELAGPMHSTHLIDLSTIDLRTITAEDWDAVKRQIYREAQAERAKAMRNLVMWLKCWSPGGKQRRDPAIDLDASSRKHALSLGGRHMSHVRCRTA